jgi:hypothetical protein
LFSDNSVRIATHTIIIIGLSSLIFSLNYAVRPLINNYIIDTHKKYKLLISLISSFSLCFFCFWFLNKNGAKYGVGSDVIIANGLYTQLFGWHLLLIYLGLLLRLLYDKKNKYFKYIAIIISLAILTHLITATFIIAVTLFYSLINKNRLFLLKSVILGLFLSSFWLVPFLLLIGDFARYNPISSSEFLKILFDYPFYSTYISVLEIFRGKIVLFDYSYLFIIAVIFSAFINSKLHKNEAFISLTFFILIFVLITNGDFPLNNFPLGMHYNRYFGLEILIITLLLNAILVCLFTALFNKHKLNYRQKLYGSLLLFLLILSFVSSLLFPNIWHKIHKIDRDYTVQDEIFRTVKNLNPATRVYVEYLKDYSFLKPRISQHYLSSLFFNDADSEAIVGIFQEQNNSYHYITTSLDYLNADTYSSPIFKDLSSSSIDQDVAIKQLKSFGINFLIAGTDKFYNSIKKYSLIKPIELGKYKIIQINNSNHKESIIINKTPVGYIDIKGNLKFNYIDYYFYLNKYLTTNYELIKLNNVNTVPTQLETLIINYLPEDINLFVKVNNLTEKKIIFLNFTNRLFIIDRYKPFYSNNFHMDTYKLVRKYFNKNVNIEAQLRSLNQNSEDQKAIINRNKSLINWQDKNQKFTLSGLLPGNIYRINYGYFPYWHTNDGQLFRGSGDRMFFIPDKSEANFKFTKLKSPSTWIGFGLTILGIAYLVMISYRTKYKKS